MEITVHPEGFLHWPNGRVQCALGKNGVIVDKHEGDLATPVGTFALRQVFYRADRLARPPITGLPLRVLHPDDGWCDAPDHPLYNREIKKPFPASHESLWREDGLYDVIVVLGHNDDPPIAGLGSAIFLHIAKPDYAGTEGCVALAQEDLLRLLEECKLGDCLRVVGPDSF